MATNIVQSGVAADVLICGVCSSQYSDLKIFIDHKETCNGTFTSCRTSTRIAEAPIHHTVATPSTSIQQSIALQPQSSPVASAGSIVNFPVGMPHVIVQSSGGVPQMYRLLLEPSVNGTAIGTGVTTAALSNSGVSLPDDGMQSPPEGTTILTNTAYAPLSVENTSLDSKRENFPDACKMEEVTSYDSTWASNPRIFDPMHTEEEDVATFLASQLVNQSSINNPKLKDVKSFESDHSQSHSSMVENHEKVSLNTIEDHQFIGDVEPRIKSVSTKPISVSNNQPEQSNEETGRAKQLNKELIGCRKKKIQCYFENCLFATFHSKDMVRHVRKHTGEKPYPCTVCGKHFSRQDKLKVHLRIHSKERPYSCTVADCYYSATEKAHLNKHMRIHTNDRPYKCQMCRYAARDGSQLTVHLRSHTGDAPFHCQVEGCSRTFKTSSDLRRHEKLHTGEKPYKCSECDYATALKSNLKVHFNINHFKDLRFTCKVCPYSGSSRKQLREHEKTHPNTSREGNTKVRPRTKPSCIKNFKCDLCSSGFVREDSFRSHMRQHQRTNSTALFQRQLSQTNLIKFKNKPQNVLNFVLQGDNNDNKELKNSSPSTASSSLENLSSSSYVITIDGLSASLYPSTVELCHESVQKETQSKEVLNPPDGSSTLTDLS